MEASFNAERKHAFVVRLSDIKKIWDLFQDRIGSVTVAVKCADAIDREFDNWPRLSSFDNPPQKKMHRLTVRSNSEDRKKSGRVEFSDRSYRSIDIGIEGPEQVVSRLSDDLSDILDGLKPWYSRITRLDFFYTIGFVLFFGFMVFQFYVTDTPKGEDQSTSVGMAILLTAAVLASCAGLALAAWGLNKLRSRYFPVAYFAIGQGEERYKVDEKIRWSIVVAFVVSIAASVVVAFLQ